MRLIDADAYSAEMKDRQEAAWKWRNEAIAEEDEVKTARAEGAFTAFTEAKLTMDKHIISPWHRVEDGLPMNKQNLLFVVYTPPYHHTELGEMPETKKVVYGLFDPKPRYGRRWWSFEDEIGECVIINEYVKEDCGEETYITHWMPLPEPPKEDI